MLNYNEKTLIPGAIYRTKQPIIAVTSSSSDHIKILPGSYIMYIDTYCHHLSRPNDFDSFKPYFLYNNQIVIISFFVSLSKANYIELIVD